MLWCTGNFPLLLLVDSVLFFSFFFYRLTPIMLSCHVRANWMKPWTSWRFVSCPQNVTMKNWRNTRPPLWQVHSDAAETFGKWRNIWSPLWQALSDTAGTQKTGRTSGPLVGVHLVTQVEHEELTECQCCPLLAGHSVTELEQQQFCALAPAINMAELMTLFTSSSDQVNLTFEAHLISVLRHA